MVAKYNVRNIDISLLLEARSRQINASALQRASKQGLGNKYCFIF